MNESEIQRRALETVEEIFQILPVFNAAAVREKICPTIASAIRSALEAEANAIEKEMESSGRGSLIAESYNRGFRDGQRDQEQRNIDDDDEPGSSEHSERCKKEDQTMDEIFGKQQDDDVKSAPSTRETTNVTQLNKPISQETIDRATKGMNEAVKWPIPVPPRQRSWDIGKDELTEPERKIAALEARLALPLPEEVEKVLANCPEQWIPEGVLSFNAFDSRRRHVFLASSEAMRGFLLKAPAMARRIVELEAELAKKIKVSHIVIPTDAQVADTVNGLKHERDQLRAELAIHRRIAKEAIDSLASRTAELATARAESARLRAEAKEEQPTQRAIERRIYDNSPERKEYLHARFPHTGCRPDTFEFDGHRWKYKHSSFNDKGEYDIIIRWSEGAASVPESIGFDDGNGPQGRTYHPPQTPPTTDPHNAINAQLVAEYNAQPATSTEQGFTDEDIAILARDQPAYAKAPDFRDLCERLVKSWTWVMGNNPPEYPSELIVEATQALAGRKDEG